MDKLSFKRFTQLVSYGWPQSKKMAKRDNAKRLNIFWDMLQSYGIYHIWSNQYGRENFYALDAEQRKKVGKHYKEVNDNHDAWVRDKFANRKFICKYTSYKWDTTESRIQERYNAYSQRYNMGEGGVISHNVVLECNHFLAGSIKIGKNVLLSKNVYIDYSGEVEIKNNVQLTNGVIIETHHHSFHSDPSVSRDIITPTKLLIEEGAVIGSRAIILSSCHYIGKNARIGAGAVVTKDIPDFAVAVGVPAKVVRFISKADM